MLSTVTRTKIISKSGRLAPSDCKPKNTAVINKINVESANKVTC